jgi:hypothetical protein
MSHKINTLIAEDKPYQKWLREQKNRILNIYNPQRRMEEWRRVIGIVQEPDDSYLLGNIF